MSHNCTPPSLSADRWTCDCGKAWVAHGHGWRAVPPFVEMPPATEAGGKVEVDDEAHDLR